MRLTLTSALLVLASLTVGVASGLCAEHTNSGAPIAVGSSDHTSPIVAPDGAGGAFVAWLDDRLGSPMVRMQRTSGSGAPLWTSEGVLFSPLLNPQANVRMIADGAGGAFLLWTENRNGFDDVYAQRVTPAGGVAWAPSAVRVFGTDVSKGAGVLVGDGNGGVFVAVSSGGGVTAQRLSALGARQWTTSGVVVANGAASAIDVARTFQGNLLVSWASGQNLLTQQFNQNGQAQWALGGVGVLPSGVIPAGGIAVASDGGEGVVVLSSAMNNVNFATAAPRVDHLDGFGNRDWNLPALTGGGCSTVYPTNPIRCGDGSFILSWGQTTCGTSLVQCARVSSGGVLLTPQPVTLGTTEGSGPSAGFAAVSAALLSDSLVSFAFVADGRGRSQRLKLPGLLLDGVKGLPFSSSPGDHASLASASLQGATYIAWQDARYGAKDVFFKKVMADGVVASADPGMPAISKVRDVPGDQGGKLQVMWNAVASDAAGSGHVVRYDLFRALPQGVSSLIGRSEHDGTSEAGSLGAPPEVVLNGVTYYWERVASVTPSHLPGYAATVATLADSNATGSHREWFIVQAWDSSTVSPGWWISAMDSGSSIDNLAPDAPSAAQGVYSGGTTLLTWTAATSSDVAGYEVFRTYIASTSLDDATRIGMVAATHFADSLGAPARYLIRAVDRNGNASAPVQVPVAGTLDVPLSPRGFSLAVAPNPSVSSSRILLSLPKPAEVTVELLDVQGRIISRIYRGAMSAGEQSLQLGALNSGSQGAPGLFFIRARSGAWERVVRISSVK